MADEATLARADGMNVGAGEFPWWAVLVQGIFAALIGLLLVTNPAATTIVFVQIVGWYWLISGVVNIVMMFIDRTQWGWKLLFGLIGVFAGMAVIQAPLWSSWLVVSVIVIYMGISGIVMGIVNLLQAFRGAGWGAGILGVLNLLLGGWLLAYRVEAALLYPSVAGIVTMIFGIMAIFVAFQVKKVQEP